METGGMGPETQAIHVPDPGRGRKEPPLGPSEESSLQDLGLWVTRTRKSIPAALSDVDCSHLRQHNTHF